MGDYTVRDHDGFEPGRHVRVGGTMIIWGDCGILWMCLAALMCQLNVVRYFSLNF